MRKIAIIAIVHPCLLTYFTNVMSQECGSLFCDSWLIAGLEFFETSAKDNINVKAVFERLVDIICDKMAESLDSDPNMIPNQTKGMEDL